MSLKEKPNNMLYENGKFWTVLLINTDDYIGEMELLNEVYIEKGN